MLRIPQSILNRIQSLLNSQSGEIKQLQDDFAGLSAGSGEANTAANVGVAGVGIYKEKSGVELRFKNLNAGSNKVTITADPGNNEVDIDVVPANLTGIPQSGITDLTTDLATKAPLASPALTGTPSAPTAAGGTNTTQLATTAFVAAALAAVEGWTVIVKSANQDVTNSGVANDSELAFAVTANAHYLVELQLVVSGNNTTADYTADLKVDSGTIRGKGTYQGLTAAGAVANVIVTAAAAANTTAVPTGVPTADLNDLVAVKMVFAFTASATTTFRYRFGNATPTSGATSRTWKGSIMRWKNLD